ncbi:uncharacterized protein N0V89_004476 [Didymosphaeria variabile]|uniref:Uncharacterized protein n=1 Tax=Didymosphaeria variabile TaxID=1932322 RepID=A0A9W8XPI2_9PLEO|nr:uncharacterized protein N0V89_004476 [Didymosphaeria variabile]KAJ4356443.1 hypothetical protein N0V89_004476 [Didymosphaeria variabile]
MHRFRFQTMENDIFRECRKSLNLQEALALLEKRNKERVKQWRGNHPPPPRKEHDMLVQKQMQSKKTSSTRKRSREDCEAELPLLEEQNKKRQAMEKMKIGSLLNKTERRNSPGHKQGEQIKTKEKPQSALGGVEYYLLRLPGLEEENKKRILMWRQEQENAKQLKKQGTWPEQEQVQPRKALPASRHALPDYQRQLSLLKEQNMKQMLMGKNGKD